MSIEQDIADIAALQKKFGEFMELHLQQTNDDVWFDAEKLLEYLAIPKPKTHLPRTIKTLTTHGLPYSNSPVGQRFYKRDVREWMLKLGGAETDQEPPPKYGLKKRK